MREESPVPSGDIEELVGLCHTLMFRFPGYPEVYATLLDRCVRVCAFMSECQYVWVCAGVTWCARVRVHRSVCTFVRTQVCGCVWAAAMMSRWYLDSRLA